ncbi:AAA family ATPase [Bacteroides ovatus]|nr:AAA family ATPase [Bacteroides ovatus]
MINREQYMEQIVPFIDKPFVKVITGIRRSGKSVVLRLIRDELLRRGVREERIIYLNFESFQWIDLKEAKALYAYIRGQAGDAGKYYILLDEIQEVDGWEKVVNSLLVDLDTDIYVTGSNSRMLSSELATYLTGRYVAFHVMTLSFREYLTFHDLQVMIRRSTGRRNFRNISAWEDSQPYILPIMDMRLSIKLSTTSILLSFFVTRCSVTISGMWNCSNG